MQLYPFGRFIQIYMEHKCSYPHREGLFRHIWSTSVVVPIGKVYSDILGAQQQVYRLERFVYLDSLRAQVQLYPLGRFIQIY